MNCAHNYIEQPTPKNFADEYGFQLSDTTRARLSLAVSTEKGRQQCISLQMRTFFLTITLLKMITFLCLNITKIKYLGLMIFDGSSIERAYVDLSDNDA